MNEWQKNVAECHRATGFPVADSPGEIGIVRKVLRQGLMREELDEVVAAMGFEYGGESDLVGLAGELVDLLYVTLGTACEYGIDLEPVFAAVHAANMRKQGGPTRADGKTLKPEGWEPADVASLIEEQSGPRCPTCLGLRDNRRMIYVGYDFRDNCPDEWHNGADGTA